MVVLVYKLSGCGSKYHSVTQLLDFVPVLRKKFIDIKAIT